MKMKLSMNHTAVTLLNELTGTDEELNRSSRKLLVSEIGGNSVHKSGATTVYVTEPSGL